MDLIIHSQIQSPIVRTLQSIPTNSESFVYGIPDNTPPFSRHKISIQPHRGEKTSLSGIQYFKIPQSGYLDKAYLKYRMVSPLISDTDANILVANTLESLNPFSIGDFIEYIELQTHNKTIQRIPGYALAFESISSALSGTMQQKILMDMEGYHGNDSAHLAQTANYMVSPVLDAGAGGVASTVLDFIVPIPLSSTFYLKDNYQTRFVEDMEIAVKFKEHFLQRYPGADYVSQIPQHDAELNLHFHNFHENVEEVIRNTNYTPEIPASLLQSDYEVISKSTSYASRGAYKYGFLQEYKFNLTSDRLVTDIFIVPTYNQGGGSYTAWSQEIGRSNVQFIIESNGSTLYDMNAVEASGYASMNFASALRQAQNEGVMSGTRAKTGFHLRFGLNHTDEYFSGGLSLASLTNTQLTINVEASTSADSTLFDSRDFVVILKYKTMIRIDSRTGRISKSLES